MMMMFPRVAVSERKKFTIERKNWCPPVAVQNKVRIFLSSPWSVEFSMFNGKSVWLSRCLPLLMLQIKTYGNCERLTVDYHLLDESVSWTGLLTGLRAEIFETGI